MYQKMYTLLFNAVSDALEALETGEVRRSEELLVQAQQACEEIYLASGEDEAEPRS